MIIVVAAIAGLLFGSFISNSLWLIYLKEHKQPPPENQKRSVCNYCGHQLGVKDLIPVLSWLWLKGRCRYCDKSLSIQYPLVELLTVGLFVLSAAIWKFEQPLDYASLVVWLLTLSGLITLAIYDLRWLILPDIAMRLSLVGAVTLTLLQVIKMGELGPLFTHALAAVAGGGFFLGLHLLGRGRWLGGGDVKLAFVMGALLGGSRLLVAMVVGFSAAAVLSLGLIAAKVLTRKDVIPFGPFLIAGTVAAMLYGHQLVNWYVDLYLY